MSVLKEFLEQQVDQVQAEASRRDAIRQDWIRSVTELVDRLRSWLREADSNGLLAINRSRTLIRERQIGDYEVPGLQVQLGEQGFGIVPVARFSIGSMRGDPLGQTIRYGRVDLANSDRKIMLYRTKADDAGDEWVMVDDRTYESRPLTAETFGEAVVSLLQ